MYRNIKRMGIFILLLLQILLFTSCARDIERRPETEVPPEEVPEIPEAVRKGEREEPSLRVYVVETQSMQEMQFEDYIAGVVAGEMKNDWPIEALAAQAILARTFVLNFIAEKGGSQYGNAHVSTDIEEAQAWDSEAVNERIKEAVERTRGKVIIFEKKFARTWFHAHAGGRTAKAKEGLDFQEDEPPYIQSVDSPDSEKAPEDDKNWVVEFNKWQVLNALAEIGSPMESFNNVSISNKGPSGRAVTIKFDDNEVSAPQLRLALGSTEMKSALLDDIRIHGDKLVIKGRGFGHGVGMSQWGAFAMAENNKTAVDIVNHYYNNVNIVKLWD